MANKAREIEQAFLANMEVETGKTLDQWMSYLEATGLSKTKELTKHIKTEFPLNHMQSTMLQVFT